MKKIGKGLAVKSLAEMTAAGYFPRDLSWLDFNSRVLAESAAPGVPLLERAKVLAIAADNREEFFMVRVATLHKLRNLGMPALPGQLSSADELPEIRRRVKKQLRDQSRRTAEFIADLHKFLGVELCSGADLGDRDRKFVRQKFVREIAGVLTPLAPMPGQPFPLLNAGAIHVAVELKSGEMLFIEVPNELPRFVELPETPEKQRRFILLEELIQTELPHYFARKKVRRSFAFTLVRDMDVDFNDDSAPSLIRSISKWLKESRRREVVKLEVSAAAGGKLLKFLQKGLRAESDRVYRNDHHLPGGRSWFELVEKLADPRYLEADWAPTLPAEFRGQQDYFAAIRSAGEILTAYPFQQFDPLVALLDAAANDPQVLAIKQTLYRVSGNSPVVAALQRAAERGKQVTVVVELKARFDEYNNIGWAKKLDRSGAHVIYGLAGLKIHCKMLMIVRKEADGIVNYLHLGTGNYNDRTARQYTDCGIFTTEPRLAADCAELFNRLTGNCRSDREFERVAAAPFNLRRTLEKLIKRETKFARAGKPGRIIAQLNSLSDPKIIKLLHQAAQAGVEIDLIVRGICSYQILPGENRIRIHSIIDRYLEHSRILFFGNDGKGKYFLSSADWMTRNLDYRVELLFPATSEAVRRQLRHILDLELQDDCKRYTLGADGKYRRSDTPDPATRSQYRRWRYFANRKKS